MASRQSALQAFLLALPVAFFFFGQGHFPRVTAGCGEASDTNPTTLNEPKGSTGHVKSTTGLPWHSSQLPGLSESVISALSNVLWGSNCTTDLTHMKPFHPFKSPHGATTTNPALESHCFRSLTLQAMQVFMLSAAILVLFHCHWYFVDWGWNNAKWLRVQFQQKHSRLLSLVRAGGGGSCKKERAALFLISCFMQPATPSEVPAVIISTVKPRGSVDTW